jgi:hypothetical protein
MDRHIISSLRAEESGLLKKLDAIRAVIALYEGEAVAAPPRHDNAPRVAASNQEITSKEGDDLSLGRGGPAYGEKVRAVARETILHATVLPVPTRDIVAEVKKAGIQISGQNELNAVSALLSRHGDFVSNGRAGWTLRAVDQRYGLTSPNENEAPNGNAAGASEAGEVGASPNENQVDEVSRLLGLNLA